MKEHGLSDKKWLWGPSLKTCLTSIIHGFVSSDWESKLDKGIDKKDEVKVYLVINNSDFSVVYLVLK